MPNKRKTKRKSRRKAKKGGGPFDFLRSALSFGESKQYKEKRCKNFQSRFKRIII